MITIHHPGSPTSYITQLNDLMQEVFGFTFDSWFSRGLWTDDYTLYSIIQNGRMLAHAAVYRMDLLVNGNPVEAYQIGAVATRPEARGRGLSRQVLEFILSRHPGAPFFLCPNETVLDFYPRFGFRLLHDRQPRVRVRLDNPPDEMHRLELDDPRVGAYIDRRANLSRVFDCADAAPIHWFHLLYEYPQNIFELPGIDAMLVAGQEGEVLTLVGLYTTRPFTFADLLPRLGFSGVREIRFGFNPDWLGVDCEWIEHAEGQVFVKETWVLEENFILPLMLKT